MPESTLHDGATIIASIIERNEILLSPFFKAELQNTTIFRNCKQFFELFQRFSKFRIRSFGPKVKAREYIRKVCRAV